MILAGLVAIFLYGSYQQLIRGHPWGIRPVPDQEKLDLTHFSDEFVEF